MKHLILNSLSLLLLSATTAPIVQAQTTTVSPTTVESTSDYKIKPENLVFLAYQGELKQYKIPSYADLLSAYESGSITAKTLVQAAIEDNKLPSHFLTNQKYLYQVDSELKSLISSNR